MFEYKPLPIEMKKYPSYLKTTIIPKSLTTSYSAKSLNEVDSPTTD